MRVSPSHLFSPHYFFHSAAAAEVCFDRFLTQIVFYAELIMTFLIKDVTDVYVDCLESTFCPEKLSNVCLAIHELVFIILHRNVTQKLSSQNALFSHLT